MDGERTYMKFEKVVIKNFRNFDNVELDLSNKNIFFGLNDVGKTNFLYALRYVFDKDIRKQNLLDSDFHNKQLDKPIEIVVTIDISDVADSDCQKLRAQLKGALLSEHNKVYIKLFAEYSKTEMLALPILSWGGDINHLYEMKQRGYLYEIDYVFNVIYIDSYVDLYSLFKKNVSQLVRNEKDEDKDILAKIQNTVDDLNGHIASLSGIKEFEDKLTPEYQKFHDEGISVSIKSEIAVKGLYSNIIPYIKQDNDDNLYPTAGEGRKKLLAYSIYDILSDENAEKKINLFLIEEPENHLHKSMQIALSQILFTDSKYTYLFVTTHSPFVNEDDIEKLRVHDWAIFNSDRRYYQRVQETGTYLDELVEDTTQPEVKTVEDFLDSIENQHLYQVLIKVDRLTLQIALMKIQGYSTREIAVYLDITEKAVYRRMDRLKEKLKKLFE